MKESVKGSAKSLHEQPIRKKFLNVGDRIWYLKLPYINSRGKLVKTYPISLSYCGEDKGKTIWSYLNKKGGTSTKKFYDSLKVLQGKNEISYDYAHLLRVMDEKAISVIKEEWESKEKEIKKLSREMDELLKAQVTEANLYLSRPKNYYHIQAQDQDQSQDQTQDH